jgi:dehydrogenase/reductase SDR family protein 7B
MKFRNKTVWITGASLGIGEACAYAFAKKGANLIISARREEQLNKVKENAEKYGVKCFVVPLDLTDTKNIGEKVKEVINQIGNIDVLFNNGGISQRSYFYETPLDIDRKVMEIDYFGHIALTKAVIPYMLENGSGHLAVNTSITGKFGFPLRSAYSASKHALHGFFDSARAELYFKNIKVTILVPGRINTEISMSAITKDGSAHGIMDHGQSGGMPVEKCASIIVRSIEKEKKEVLIGGKEVLLAHIRRFIPSLYYKIAAKVKPT